ncbi:hypothetical protein F4553_006817 [Allocatelliglobosispora scoriae]|uniref:Uncharacterized protein n=1 Tax=Allocatelliglobosispora scoriae TaxID=643052 RepID=A0A841C2N2_9ACTN|nr:hypothetical protein [Allocatelliglobosispora scoriae]MBB5873383.1 hypothetical protein [Allocatelliglobosispora scoriae]
MTTRKIANATGLDEFLRDYQAGGYPVAEVVHAACADCGGTVFAVLLDDEAGFVERWCTSCEADGVAMLDSAEYAEEAEPGEATCPCGGEYFEVAVGFSRNADGDIRWVSVGLRCVADGLAGVYIDWKIDYLPAEHLLTTVR